MKIAICILIIALTILLVLVIGLIIRCNNQSQRIFKSKKDYDELKANYIATVNTNNLLEKEVKRLNSEVEKQFDELNNLPVQTLIKEVVANPKIKTFEVKRILTADVIRFGGEGYKEMTKKQMVQELSEALALNDLVTFYEEKDFYRMEEIITARIDVLGR